MQGRCWATSAWAWVGIFTAHRLPVISSEKGFGVSVPLYNVLICVCILGEETLFSWTSGEENWLNEVPQLMAHLWVHPREATVRPSCFTPQSCYDGHVGGPQPLPCQHS